MYQCTQREEKKNGTNVTQQNRLNGGKTQRNDKRLSYEKEEPSSESKEVTFPAQYLNFIKLEIDTNPSSQSKQKKNGVTIVVAGVTQIAAE